MRLQPVIAAIDQGYGWSKGVCQAGDDIVYRGAFPSIALPGDADGSMGAGFASLRVLKMTPQEWQTFMCGPDIVKLTDGMSNDRQRTPDYPLQLSYKAMVQCNLALMDQDVVDVLVVGVPLHNMHYKDHLVEIFRGRHWVPRVGGAPGEHRSVDVMRVVVLPQPGGALYAALEAKPDLATQKVLVIDLGYYTMDYLFAIGKQAFQNRSGVVEGGISGFLDELNRAAAIEYQRAYPQIRKRMHRPHQDYEEALLNGCVLETSMGPLDLRGPLDVASRKLGAYLSQMHKLGNTDDVRNVVFAGGGAQWLKPQFAERFPWITNLIDLPEPQMAIVDGFLIAGRAFGRSALK